MIMKKAKLTTVILASLFALNSCQKDESSIVDDQEFSVTDEAQESELEITAEVLEENNFFNTSDIALENNFIMILRDLQVVDVMRRTQFKRDIGIKKGRR